MLKLVSDESHAAADGGGGHGNGGGGHSHGSVLGSGLEGYKPTTASKPLTLDEKRIGRLHNVFAYYDVDKSGVLERNELLCAMVETGFDADNALISALLVEARGDGRYSSVFKRRRY
jgi:hypothetical protein